MLVVLFPVISATDDLYAMGAEMEESAACKNGTRQPTHERLSASKWQTQPALVAAPGFSFSDEWHWLSLTPASSFTTEADADLRPGRAPPVAVLG